MLDLRAMYRARFDGLEATLFGVVFTLTILGSRPLGLALDIAGAGALGLGFAVVWGLRRIRPTRVAPAAEGSSSLPTTQTFGPLLLGIGTLVIVVATFLGLVAVSLALEPGNRDIRLLVALGVVLLLVGTALLLAGVRAAGRPR